jgi:hypothetical protein
MRRIRPGQLHRGKNRHRQTMTTSNFASAHERGAARPFRGSITTLNLSSRERSRGVLAA